MNPFYKDYSEYLSEKFPGRKIQKISVNAGFSCPNRDGTIGTGGCIYCDNSSFTPDYCFKTSGVKEQLEAGKIFFGRKYPDMRYLAYFQSFTNTFFSSLRNVSGNAKEEDLLEGIYKEALEVEGVEGLIIGSRPDCFPPEIISMLEKLNRRKPLFVEIGAESSHNETLRLINRGHSWEQTVDAVTRLSDKGISVGVHLICGLPGEDENMILQTVERVCELPIESLKFHHLQVIKGTPLHRAVQEGSIQVSPYAMDDYLELCCKIVQKVPHKIAIERFLASSPPEKVVMPRWGVKNYQFTNLLHNLLKKKSQ